MKKHNRTKTFFGCYGSVLSGDYLFKADAAVIREGGRKRYCRTCLNLLLKDVKAQAIKALNAAGLK